MDQALTVPLFNQVQPDVAARSVQGLTFDANIFFMLYDVWLAQ